MFQHIIKDIYGGFVSILCSNTLPVGLRQCKKTLTTNLPLVLNIHDLILTVYRGSSVGDLYRNPLFGHISFVKQPPDWKVTI
jgi:hypothetical protein